MIVDGPGSGTGRDGGEAILIALLIALGVDLIVVVAFAVLVFGRRRWLKRQPGEFAGAIRVSSGDVDGLSPKWRRGSGRWVRDVFVWSKAPFSAIGAPVIIRAILGARHAPGPPRTLQDTRDSQSQR